MAEHNAFGQLGEEEAALYLTTIGYRLVERNWRCGHEEIDIIADDFGELVFVEVKTRRNERLTRALDDVDRIKQMHLMSAAFAYLSRYDECPTFRFDVVTIVGEQPPYHLKHYVNVFTPWGLEVWRREHHRPKRK